MKRLENKVAIITGGSGSIGFATAQKLATEGAKVLLVDIDEKSLKKKQKEAEKDNLDISHIVADVTRAKDVQNYVDTALERYGKIDLFFNNAAIEGMIKPIEDYPEDKFDQLLAVNVKGVFLGMKYVIPEIEVGGSIVITSSIAGLSGGPDQVAYTASKHAVIGIMRTAVAELSGQNIRVNTVHPGFVDNQMSRSLRDGINPGKGEKVKAEINNQIPMGRHAKPEEISNMVAFLFSEESSYAHGNTFVVDGGFTS